MRPQHAAFARHFVEMLVAMLVGMGAASALLALGSAAAGSGYTALERDEPALVLIVLVAGMTGAMVAWMRFRGHAPGLVAEMAGAMVVSGVAILAVMAAGVDGTAALHAHHPVMLAAMLGAMLLRRREYSVAPGASLQQGRPRPDAASGF